MRLEAVKMFRVNGAQRSKSFRTHQDAKAFRRKIEGEELVGLITDPKGGESLFFGYADAWVEHRMVKGRPLTPATKQGYRALLRRHLHPAFGATSSARSRLNRSGSGTPRPPSLRRMRRQRATGSCGPS